MSSQPWRDNYYKDLYTPESLAAHEKAVKDAAARDDDYDAKNKVEFGQAL